MRGRAITATLPTSAFTTAAARICRRVRVSVSRPSVFPSRRKRSNMCRHVVTSRRAWRGTAGSKAMRSRAWMCITRGYLKTCPQARAYPHAGNAERRPRHTACDYASQSDDQRASGMARPYDRGRAFNACIGTLRRAPFHASAVVSAGPSTGSSTSVEAVDTSTASDCVRASAAKYRPGECPSAFLNMVMKAVTDS